eukprot:TRINITY_DN19391_c0_g1_i1.p1 TRINITY_DN19391_c0_g1~~TRINITY_DN19391_c0_g1_i1.p1  ORF type:complete len:401 (-),score=94.76 TRINITY_DN19391_c0_g1_i1:22-1224(-)
MAGRSKTKKTKSPKTKKPTRSKKLKKRKEESSEEEFEDGDSSDERSDLSDEAIVEGSALKSRDYFTLKAGDSKTSDNTLSNLQELLDPSQIKEALEDVTMKHEEEKAELIARYMEEQFPKWNFELQQGFSVFLYGYGSKKQILEAFAKLYLKDDPTVLVQGFVPHVTIRSILDVIVRRQFGEMRKSFRSPNEQLDFVRDCFQHPNNYNVPRRMYILIHNIDGSSLRSEVAQSVIAALSSIPHVSLIASVDHLNSPALWDLSLREQFRWVWHDVTTFTSYDTELSYEQPIMGSVGSDITANGLRFIFRSLTSNSRGIFRVLAEHQISNPKEHGLSYKTYFDKCREKFLVPSDLTMRTQLTEFKDHKVILTKQGDDGLHFFIPMSSTILRQVLDEMDEVQET